jgi:carbonic anhydrase
MNFDEALERLLEGNGRYAGMQQVHPRQTTYHRQILVEGQNPFACILSCSDSRVPSELIFDQGLGDLFIVRTAGHTVNGLVLASIEYAVFALNVPLVLVLGHRQCGAVTAVLRGYALPGHMPELAEYLQPAVTGMDRDTDAAIEQAVRANARYTTNWLAEHSAVLSEAVAQKRARIVAAYYDLETGRVDLLD